MSTRERVAIEVRAAEIAQEYWDPMRDPGTTQAERDGWAISYWQHYGRGPNRWKAAPKGAGQLAGWLAREIAYGR